MVKVGEYLGLGVELDAPLVALLEEQLRVVSLVVVRVFELLCRDQLVDVLGVTNKAPGIQEPCEEIKNTRYLLLSALHRK